MRRLVAACLLVAVVIPAVPAPAAQAAPTPLQLLLEARVAGFPGGSGIFVSDPLSGAVLYSHDPDELVVTASLYKLGVLLEAERRVDAGTLKYADPITIDLEDVNEDGSFEPAGTTLTVDEALERMITVSDNGTALALEHHFTAAQINVTLAANGIKPFRLWEVEGEDNEASPRAVATFFALLAQRKLISRAASDRMLQRLGRQQINDRLPAQLPPGSVVAHKTGNLAFVTHDAGIIYGKSGDPVVVVAMTWNSGAEEAVELIQDIGSLVYANALTTPTNVGFGVPQQAVLADAGRPLVQTVKVTNLGLNDWTVGTPDPFRLIWEIADARGALVGKSPAPIRLWNVATNASIEVPVIIPVPPEPAEYKVTFGLMDDRHGPLAPLGTATGSFVVRAHPPYLVTLGAALSPVLHRDEPSAVIVTMSSLLELGAERELQLGWRVLDPRNNRVLAQGAGPLGRAKPATTLSVLAALDTPSLRGAYVVDIFAVADGHPVSSPLRKTILIAGPRTYPGELSVGEGRGVPSGPRPTPRPSPGKTPAGKTPLPRP